MLTQYDLHLTTSQPNSPQLSWSYLFYAALLEQAPSGFASLAHLDAATPISQYLHVRQDGSLIWTINLLGADCEQTMIPILEDLDSLYLRKKDVCFSVVRQNVTHIESVDELFFRSRNMELHRLEFCTPTAFKQHGRYVNLPTPRLLLQSLIRQWNGCITECPVEDEDGEGLNALAEGLQFRQFRLQDSKYRLKGHMIPGFTGSLTTANVLSGFHHQLVNALLLFSGFSGVGIKTTLGMGGTIHRARFLV